VLLFSGSGLDSSPWLSPLLLVLVPWCFLWLVGGGIWGVRAPSYEEWELVLGGGAQEGGWRSEVRRWEVGRILWKVERGVGKRIGIGKNGRGERIDLRRLARTAAGIISASSSHLFPTPAPCSEEMPTGNVCAATRPA